MKQSEIYKEVTERIIKILESDKPLKWLKEWNTGLPQNYISKKEYKGINALMLQINRQEKGYKQPYYLTFKQINGLNERVKKGEKGEFIIYYEIKEINNIKEKWNEDKKEMEREEIRIKIPFIRYYYVFNIEQTTLKPKDEGLKFNPIEKAEQIIKGYKDRPNIEHKGFMAYYQPEEDIIILPHKDTFQNEAGFYSTLFHELSHSTGHKSRLNRALKPQIGFNEEYSREEIIAELSTAFLTAKAGINNDTINNNSAYIKSWIKELKQDSKYIFRISAEAQKSASYILKGA